MISSSGDLIVAIIAIGMGISFVWADPKSPTSRALALALCLIGLGWLMNVPNDAGVFKSQKDWWTRAFSIVEGATFATFMEWALRIGRAESSARSASAERLLRVCQALAILYGLLGVLFPEVRTRSFIYRQQPGALTDPGYYLFAVPLYLSIALAVPAFGVWVFRSQQDRAEHIRVWALIVATPFLMSGIWFHSWRPVGGAIGMMIFLAGAVRYHMIQGQRAQFMGRFLAPEVGRLVRERGFAAATQESRVELSVVACDLRGFTAFSDTAAPEEVMQLLRDYYTAIGEVVTQYGGTIESFAGDGIMVLVGAPLPYPDHAGRAVGMALKILDRAAEVLSASSRAGLEVGIGVGIASGYVTVGVIGGAARLEYVAVGPALNLASRLCSYAQPGQVLTDQRFVAVIDNEGGSKDRPYRFERVESVELKGFARPVTVFAVTP